MSMKKGGLIVKKKEMTKMWHNDAFIPVTLLQILPQTIVRQKTQEKDGYTAVIVGAGKKVLNKTKGQKESFSYMIEFPLNDDALSAFEVGKELSGDLLEGVQMIDITGTSKGKGFQGVMKRFHHKGGPETHGSKFHRAIGSTGNRKPRRTQKGYSMPGHMGSETVTIKNRPVIELLNLPNEKLIAVKGSVPGSYNGYLKIYIK